MSEVRISEIWTYPIKSLGGVRLSSTWVKPKGLVNDRRFMLIDADGTAMTQRVHPTMALFKTHLTDGLIAVAFGGDAIQIPADFKPSSKAVSAQVWSDTVRVHEVSDSFSTWFSERLGVSCKLVFFPEENERAVDHAFQINDEHVSLADAYPLLAIGQSSLDDLNSRLDTPVPMNRFRPNLVVANAEAFAEDNWKTFDAGEARFAAVKPCARCVLTTVDQESGKKGPEPLRTLATYRTKNNKVLFGQNLLVLKPGRISEGDVITVETRGAL